MQQIRVYPVLHSTNQWLVGTSQRHPLGMGWTEVLEATEIFTANDGDLL